MVRLLRITLEHVKNAKFSENFGRSPLTIAFISGPHIFFGIRTSSNRGLNVSRGPSTVIRDADFMFENTPVKIVVNRNCPVIELAGLKVGPFKEGEEHEVRFWIANELERAGIARLREEESLDAVRLYKMHWKESVQPATQISSLSKDFYPRLRRYLASLKRESIKRPEKMKEYEKATRLSRDIVNCRLKKIVSLASAPAQTDQTLKNLTKEERVIYDSLRKIIDSWKSDILKGK